MKKITILIISISLIFLIAGCSTQSKTPSGFKYKKAYNKLMKDQQRYEKYPRW